LLSGTLTIILFLIPKTLVSVVLGDKWLMTVPIIKALSLFGFIRAVTISFNPLFNSLKKQNIVSHYTFISTLVMSILIIPMVLKWQVIGATYAVVIGSISALPIILFYYIKLFYEES
jgi:O-antigen/teichoic acid export membrane protein